MRHIFRHTISLSLALALLALVGCSRQQVTIKVVDVFHESESSQVQVLYTETTENVSCPIGAHGCTYDTLQQDLFQVTLPLVAGTVSEDVLRNSSRWIRSGSDQNDYTYFRSNQSMVFGNTLSETLEICAIKDDGCTSNLVLQISEAARKQPVISDTGQTFLWHNTLYSAAGVAQVSLGERLGYQSFIADTQAMQEADSTNSSLRTYLFADLTLLALPSYASAANAPIGIAYSIQENTSQHFLKEFDHGGASIEVLAIGELQNEYFFLLNFFDFEDGTFNQILDTYYLYSTADESLLPIEDPNYQEGEHIWDVASQTLYSVDVVGSNSLRITESKII